MPIHWPLPEPPMTDKELRELIAALEKYGIAD